VTSIRESIVPVGPTEQESWRCNSVGHVQSNNVVSSVIQAVRVSVAKSVLGLLSQRFHVGLFQSVDDKLFEKIVCNPVHVLQPLIPDRPPSSYDLRLRNHDKLLLNKTSYLNDREFIIRMLYKDSY